MTTAIQPRSRPSLAPIAAVQPMPPAPRRPVRVCFLIDDLNTAGTETQLIALIRELDRTRVQPFLCLLRGESRCSQALEPAECPVLRLGAGSLCRATTLVHAWRFARYVRRERIDVLQVYFPDSTYFGVPVAWLARIPRIVRTRNNLGYWMTPWHRGLGRFCNRFTDVLVANCDAARQSVIANEKLAGERVVVLENGVDLARFRVGVGASSRRGCEIATRRIGVVGNLRPVKGLDNFIRAASNLIVTHCDLTFHIAGDGPLRSDLKRLAVEHGLKNRFVLEGTLVDVPGFLAGLDIAVLPSRSEGMSNALLEYMAAGKPIVATAVGGNTQLIDDGVHGLLVPPDDPDALAAAISRLIMDADLATQMGRAARKRVEERYSREAMVRRFEKFYLQLMANETSGQTRANDEVLPS
jgi:glycosyltransferase involved in cell wall biosynthesis